MLHLKLPTANNYFNAIGNYNYQVNKVSTINSYTPRNKKLLTYPYCYMVLSNNNGSSNVLHYEKFTGTKCDFVIAGVPTPRLLYKMHSK